MAIEWTCRLIAWYAENLKWFTQKVYEIDLARNIKPENLYPKYIKGISFPGYKLLWCANTLDFAGIKLPFTNLQFHCVKSVQIGSFFWSAFFCIWTEYREIQSISPYSLRMYLVRMRENTDQKKRRIRTLFTQCSADMELCKQKRKSISVTWKQSYFVIKCFICLD